METYQIVVAIIIFILLALLLLYIILKYSKLFIGPKQDTQQPYNIINQSISIQSPPPHQTHDVIQSFISIQEQSYQSNEQQSIQEISKRQDYDNQECVKLIIQDNEYQIIKISTNYIIYEQEEKVVDVQKHNSIVYNFKFDKQYNQTYQITETMNNESAISQWKTNKIQIKGKKDDDEDSEFNLYQLNEDLEQLGKYYFNQFIKYNDLIQGSGTIINAFAQHLNNENLKQYIKDNQNHKKTNKPVIFFPSYILNIQFDEKQFIEQYKNYVIQYQPIKYNLELIYSKLYFITSYQENNNEYFIIEINHSNLVKIHDLKDKSKQNFDYNPYIIYLKNIIPSLSLSQVICVQCLLNQRQKQSYFQVCLNMLKESENKILVKSIQSEQQLKTYLQNLIQF